MSKPRVAAFLMQQEFYEPYVSLQRDSNSGGIVYPLIRLTDHEAAMAELHDDYNDAAEDAMAIARRFRDTEAERNELLGLLREVSARATLMGWEPGLIGDIDAALAKLGKE